MLTSVEYREDHDRRADPARVGGRRAVDALKPGPKPLDGEPAAAAIRIRVTARQRAELAQVAAELDMDISAIIRDAVNEFVADYSDDRKVFPSRGPR